MGCFSKNEEPNRRPNRDQKRVLRDEPETRTCTDVIPLILFMAFICGSVIITAYSFVYGDSYRVIYGVDSFGNTCGRNNGRLVSSLNQSDFLPFSGQDMTLKKYLLPLDPTRPFTSPWICVENCPSLSIDTSDDLNTYLKYHNYSYCTSWTPNKTGITRYLCPKRVLYRSSGTILSRCVPDDFINIGFDLFLQLQDYVENQDWVRRISNEITSVKSDIAILCLASAALSLAMVFLIQFLAPIVVYFICIAVVFLAACISAFLWYAWYIAFNSVDHELPLRSTFSDLKDITDEKTIIICAIVSSIMTLIVLLVVWCLWPRGGLIVDLFREAGRALRSVQFLLVQPIVTCIILVIFVTAWILVTVQLLTSAPAVPSKVSQTEGEIMESVTFNMTESIRYMFYYQFVSFIWVTEFIFASHRMVVAGAVASWYFKRQGTQSYWCLALSNLVFYHLGSVAFGSFIITMVKLPRYIFIYIYSKLKTSDGILAKYVSRCIIALLACIEKFLRYLHHNAYTVIAINGQSFCPASKMATNILLDNAVDVATINTVGDFVLFLAKFIVADLSLAAAIFRFKYQLSLEYWMFCSALIAVFAYLISSCFMAVVEMVIDTLFLCFAEDTDIVNRSNGAVDYADSHFKDYMNSTLVRERALNRREYYPSEKGVHRSWEMAAFTTSQAKPELY